MLGGGLFLLKHSSLNLKPACLARLPLPTEAHIRALADDTTIAVAATELKMTCLIPAAWTSLFLFLRAVTLPHSRHSWTKWSPVESLHPWLCLTQVGLAYSNDWWPEEKYRLRTPILDFAQHPPSQCISGIPPLPAEGQNTEPHWCTYAFMYMHVGLKGQHLEVDSNSIFLCHSRPYSLKEGPHWIPCGPFQLEWLTCKTLASFVSASQPWVYRCVHLHPAFQRDGRLHSGSCTYSEVFYWLSHLCSLVACFWRLGLTTQWLIPYTEYSWSNNTDPLPVHSSISTSVLQ